MSAFNMEPAVATYFFRNLRGGSQPILVQASDGLPYVVKFNNNLQGENLPFNESVGSELYRACGLEGPSWKPLLITDDFIDKNRACWMETQTGRLRPDSGLCFSSRYLGLDGIRLLEILPGSSLKRVRNRDSFWLAWLVDICASHADNRQAVFVEKSAGRLEAFFIDHGHLFGGPRGELQRKVQASRYLDPRIYKKVSSLHLLNLKKFVLGLDVEQLWRQIRTMPEEWKTTSALGGFAQCLNSLSTSTILQNIIDSMMDFVQTAEKSKYEKPQFIRKSPVSILYPRVQESELERCFATRGCDCIARPSG
jgi:hypothetical protein